MLLSIWKRFKGWITGSIGVAVVTGFFILSKLGTLPAGAIHYYPLNADTLAGQITADSGTVGVNGTFINGVFDSVGAFVGNGCAIFPDAAGGNNAIVIPDQTSFDACSTMTICGAFYFNDTGSTTQALVDMRIGGSAYPIGMYWQGSVIRMYVDTLTNTEYYYGGGSGTNKGRFYKQWVHFAAVVNNSNCSLFINGIGAEMLKQGTPNKVWRSDTITIGNSNTSTGYARGFSGRIDEIAMYKTALTGDQIRGMMPRVRYWVGTATSGVWSNTANWALTSGAIGGCPIPTADDIVYFDAGSVVPCTLDVSGAANIIISDVLYTGSFIQNGNKLTTKYGMLWTGGSGILDDSIVFTGKSVLKLNNYSTVTTAGCSLFFLDSATLQTGAGMKQTFARILFTDGKQYKINTVDTLEISVKNTADISGSAGARTILQQNGSSYDLLWTGQYVANGYHHSAVSGSATRTYPASIAGGYGDSVDVIFIFGGQRDMKDSGTVASINSRFFMLDSLRDIITDSNTHVVVIGLTAPTEPAYNIDTCTAIDSIWNSYTDSLVSVHSDKFKYSFWYGDPLFYVTLIPGDSVHIAKQGYRELIDILGDRLDLLFSEYTGTVICMMAGQSLALPYAERGFQYMADRKGLGIWYFSTEQETLSYMTVANSYSINVQVVNNETSIDSGGNTNWMFGQAPTYVSISPASGDTAGGTSITITGTHFYSPRGTGTVTIGGVALASYTSWADGQIIGITGAHAAGVVNVVITNSYGLSVTATGVYEYTSGATPDVVSPGISGGWSGGWSGKIQ